MTTIGNVQKPVAVSVKTAGYTIPNSRVARLTVNLEGSATFTIDGVTALRGTQNSVLGSSGLAYTSTLSGQLNTGNTGSNGAASFTSATDQKTVVAQLTVPAGTIINGTGTFRIIVEEYYA